MEKPIKVLLVNGSTRKKGCTATALAEIETQLHASGIQTEWFHVGNRVIRGCTACEVCHKKKDGYCVFGDDGVNELIEQAKECDGFIFGSPVHYAAVSGSLTSLLDRAFYSSSKSFCYKPASCIVSCRRGGSSAALDQLLKYLTISHMPVVTSQYWNMVHGNSPEEVRQDLEGMQTMRMLGKNMAWMLKLVKAGEKEGIVPPQSEKRQWTNFIR